jgi:hypothetical protein
MVVGDGTPELVDDLSDATISPIQIGLPMTPSEAKDFVATICDTFSKTVGLVNTAIELVHLVKQERIDEIHKYMDWMLGFGVTETIVLASSVTLACAY